MKMKRNVLLSAALFAAAMCSLAVINSASSRTQDMNSNGNMSRGTDQKMMALSSMDKKFMMMAAQGGMAEVAMGRMAAERASSEDVKRYAAQMVEDHTKAGEELMQLATAKGVTLPTEPDAKHKALMAKMQMLSGEKFDMEYVKNAGIKDHEKMQKLFQDEMSKGKDAEAKAFAAKTLPTVQMHLQMARDMMSAMMGGMKDGSKMKM